MHEEAMVRDLRAKFVELGRERPSERIVRVSMWVGALSHLTAPELSSLWEKVTEGTPAEGAQLSVEASGDLHDPRAHGIVLRDVTFRGGP